MNWSRLLVSCGVLAALSASPESEAQSARETVDGASLGYVAVRVSDGGHYEVIDALNAESLFVPASVLKLVTVSAALEHLGADYRWRTRLVAAGAFTDGVLDGDLVIQPGADPTWGNAFFKGGAVEPLGSLATQIRAGGLVRVKGDLVVDRRRFPGRSHPLDRAYGDLPYRHGTPTAAFAVDEATITVRVAPAQLVGEPARVSAPEWVDVLNHTTTVGGARHGAGTLDFVPVWGTETLLLRGEYPISEGPFVVAISDPMPEVRAARKLRVALEEVGVVIEGVVRLGLPSDVPNGRGDILAELSSRPLRDILRRILWSSHNWYADMLTLTLSKEVAGTGRFDDGVRVVSSFLEGLSADESTSPPRPWLRDGSGLSPANLVTPISIVGLLGHALERNWGGTLVAALAGPGEGTLAGWPSVPKIAAKTGTLRHTVGLAGFLDAGSEGPIIFCYFVNHLPGPPAVARRQIATALTRWRSIGQSR